LLQGAIQLFGNRRELLLKTCDEAWRRQFRDVTII